MRQWVRPGAIRCCRDKKRLPTAGICWPAQLQVQRRAISEVEVLTKLVEPDIRTSTLRPVN